MSAVTVWEGRRFVTTRFSTDRDGSFDHERTELRRERGVTKPDAIITRSANGGIVLNNLDGSLSLSPNEALHVGELLIEIANAALRTNKRKES